MTISLIPYSPTAPGESSRTAHDYIQEPDRLRRPTDLVVSGVVGVSVSVFLAIILNLNYFDGFQPQLLMKMWNGDESLIGDAFGEWGPAVVVAAIKLIPGSQSVWMGLLSSSLTMALIVIFLRYLLAFGWTYWESCLFTLVLACHPLVVAASVSGSASILSAFTFMALILSVDRLESVGDVQSQMQVGLLLALLILVDADAIHYAMALFLLVPICYRDIDHWRSYVSAVMVVIFPPLIGLATVAYIYTVFTDQSWEMLLRRWASPMHGATEMLPLADWLHLTGGSFIKSFILITGLTAVMMPAWAAILWRLARSRFERQVPGTALAALLVPTIGGASATFFWHASGCAPALIKAIAGMAVWVGTSRFPTRVRRSLLVLCAIGTLVSWLLFPLIGDREMVAWWESLFHPVGPVEHWTPSPLMTYGRF
ncbi:hypothetical protein [Telmatospirillum siberiense]|uniref:Glycosyltransferase RgtA/B/C/D-like domain-containing protein n=1 Tax=Telmatospirillum siberiense TaxID=382514 RepID=A0A2N3PVJ6_9PROT|nr:hypothetical protein [Telmatospirillum siberiense]PKU24419.1 hypothetical protein CWS72_11255 [Telmatospirillum siberiense]